MKSKNKKPSLSPNPHELIGVGNTGNYQKISQKICISLPLIFSE
jgi:hypothetical protein